MIYSILFLGLPVLGVILYRHVLNAMAVNQVPKPPRMPLFFVFAAYGAVLLFIVSECCKVWSGMHSIAAVGLFIIGMPWLFVQGFLWRGTWGFSVYHRVTIVLSLVFPAMLGILVRFAFK